MRKFDRVKFDGVAGECQEHQNPPPHQNFVLYIMCYTHYCHIMHSTTLHYSVLNIIVPTTIIESCRLILMEFHIRCHCSFSWYKCVAMLALFVIVRKYSLGNNRHISVVIITLHYLQYHSALCLYTSHTNMMQHVLICPCFRACNLIEY